MDNCDRIAPWIREAAKALVIANADRGRTFDNSPDVEETAQIIAAHVPQPTVVNCSTCKVNEEAGVRCAECGRRIGPIEGVQSEGWISVEEKLPLIGTEVLVWRPERWERPYDLVTYTKESDEHRRCVRRDGQWWDSGKQITYWQPMPSPPTGKETK